MNIKMRIKQWLRDFLHPIVWNDLGLRVIKRELDDTWQITQNLRKEIEKLMKQKEIDNNSEQSQYCQECCEKQKRIDELEKALQKIQNLFYEYREANENFIRIEYIENIIDDVYEIKNSWEEQC